MTNYRMPNLLLVGAQKCGTSHVHQVLSQAPEIVGSDPKELNYFNQKNHAGDASTRAYQEHFPVGRERYYLESTPHYFRLPITAMDYSGPVTRDVAKAIEQALPADDLQLLVILRNPVERALSATVHHMAKNRLAAEAVLRTLSEEHGIIARGYYRPILAHWKSLFGDTLRVFFYDDLLTNPLDFYRSIATWLEIDDKFLTTVDLQRRTNSSESLAKASALNTRPPASPKLIEELIERYREDIHGLFLDCGVNYEDWLSIDAIAERWC